MSDKPQTTNFDYEKFFRTARGWVFQAAECNPDENVSIGSMEWMYQAFKARMEAEREQSYKTTNQPEKPDGSQTTPYDFERVIKSHGLEKLVICQSQYDHFVSMGCSPDLLHLSEPLPVDPPIQQPKDWYRHHG